MLLFLLINFLTLYLINSTSAEAIDYSCSTIITRPAAEEASPSTTPVPKNITISGLSNDFVFNYQEYFATNNLTCSENKIRSKFFSLGNGVGVALRSTPSSVIDYYRTLLIIQVANSQADDTTLNTDCGPVSLSEIFLGLKDEKIFKSSPSAIKTTLPSTITDSLSQKNPTLSQSKNIYQLLFRQLNFIPDKPVTGKILVDGQSKDRDIPGGYAVASTQGQGVVGFLNSQVKKKSTTDFCQANVSQSIFSAAPAPVTFSLFGNSESNTSQIDYQIPQGFGDGTAAATNAFSNLLPSKLLKQYSSIPFSSKTSENQDTPVVDPGYKANILNANLNILRSSF